MTGSISSYAPELAFALFHEGASRLFGILGIL
jgi:hypothetical protein